ncbi:MAG: trigger factor [Actinomycetota bacterium]|nr:trigger factor [Actinomycetota bacterium]
MAESSVQTSSERVGKDRVKLRVEVQEGALGPALSAAYQRWAKEIKVPGFRKGKVPRQLIDARVGPETVREEALKDALPGFYREAVTAEDLQPIAPPEIEVLEFETGNPLVFEATVDLRPEIQIPELSTLTVEAPSEDVTDEDITEQLDRLRDRFAELETVSREARRGDYVLIDIKGSRHDQPVEGASAPDLLYEVGSRNGPAKLDDELEGNRAGAILRFNDTMPGDEEDVSFTVLLKEVKAKKLPPLDDEFAKTAGEFDVLDDLKNDLRERLKEVKASAAAEELRGAALNALLEAINLESPEKLVESEFEHRLEHFQGDLDRAGLSMSDYERASQSTELEIRKDIRDQAARSVAAELVLEEIARREEMDVTEDDIGREIAYLAARLQREPKDVAEDVVKGGRLGALAADIMRRKALDYVVASITVPGRATHETVEVEGNP